jgi:hypothetical protein
MPRCQQCLPHLLAVAMILAAGGCALLVDPSGYAYVFRKGGPENITAWTLRQTTERRVRDGRSALLEIADTGYPEKRAEAAVEGLLLVHQKLYEGWEGLELNPRLNYTTIEEFCDAMEKKRGRESFIGRGVTHECAAGPAVRRCAMDDTDGRENGPRRHPPPAVGRGKQ